MSPVRARSPASLVTERAAPYRPLPNVAGRDPIMIKRIVSRRPSHGTVVAYLALFVALSGTAYAANEWTGRNIVNGSIKSVDLGRNSVNGAKVENNSIKGADVLESSLGAVPAAAQASSVVPGAIGA